jgi:hypothetical protein
VEELGDSSGRFSLRELVALLAPTLGQERSREAILGAAGELGLAGEAFAWEEALSVLDRLARGTGILALAARFARDRLANHVEAPLDAPASRRPSYPAGPRRAPSTRPFGMASEPGRRIAVTRLKAQLAPALGQEKSDQLVAEAMLWLRLGGEDLALEQALSVLDRLGATPGLVGVTARFARARLPRVVEGDPQGANPGLGGAAR